MADDRPRIEWPLGPLPDAQERARRAAIKRLERFSADARGAPSPFWRAVHLAAEFCAVAAFFVALWAGLVVLAAIVVTPS